MRVVWSSPYIPPEYIAAHGLSGVRTLAAAPQAACHQGRCATAAGLAAAGEGDDLLLVASSCDQMRRSAEERPRTFRFDLPATWTTANAARLYRDELLRLSRFLVRHGGREPHDLATQLLDHDARRARLRAACACLPARAAAEACARYAADGSVPARDAVPQPADGRLPVVLLGGPLPPSSFALYDVIEAAGARIALDGSEGGERGLAAPCDRRLAAADPLAAIVDCYFLAIPDAFRRPDSLLYAWLDRHVAERGLRAILVHPDPWCDLWRAVLPRLKDWGRLPAILVEADADPGTHARLATRVQALVEMLT